MRFLTCTMANELQLDKKTFSGYYFFTEIEIMGDSQK